METEYQWQPAQIAVSLLAIAFVMYLVVEGRFLGGGLELTVFYVSIVVAGLAAIAGLIPTSG